MSNTPLSREHLERIAKTRTHDSMLASEEYLAIHALLERAEVAERGCQMLRLELEALRGEHATLVSTVETLQGVTTALAEEAKDLNGDVNMLRSALAEKTREHTHLQDLLTKSESERGVLAEREAGLKARIAQLEKERDTHWANFCERSGDFKKWRAAEAERDAAMARAAMLREALECRHSSRGVTCLGLAGLSEQNRCAACRARTDSADVSAWLSERLKQEREATQVTMREHAVRCIDEVEPIQHVTVGDALRRRDAKVRAAALEEAADHAEDWTCPQCDQDTARDLASEIRALASTPSETKEPK